LGSPHYADPGANAKYTRKSRLVSSASLLAISSTF
jgi:hypothetical protein